MDVSQIRRLKPKLTQFLRRFDDCFPRKDTRAHLPVYITGQLSELPHKSVEPIALEADVAPRTLQELTCPPETGPPEMVESAVVGNIPDCSR